MGDAFKIPMKPNRASRTAEYIALYRAMESARPQSKRLFTDPFAVHFLRPSLRRMAALCRIPGVDAAVAWYTDRRALGARTSAIARTRLIDDLVCQALRDGIRQMVILGAGFDCRFYRLPQLGSAAAFEVDSPAMVAAKSSRLRALFRELPLNVRFVKIDFERQHLLERLQAETFDPGQPAMFVWEGVTNYLTASAVDAVLRYIAACGNGSRLVFTYVHRSALDGSGRFKDAGQIISNVEKLGEPWIFGLTPEELPSFLCSRGLRLIQDHGAREYRRTYFGTAAESMRGYDFYHVAVATVPERT